MMYGDLNGINFGLVESISFSCSEYVAENGGGTDAFKVFDMWISCGNWKWIGIIGFFLWVWLMQRYNYVISDGVAEAKHMSKLMGQNMFEIRC